VSEAVESPQIANENREIPEGKTSWLVARLTGLDFCRRHDFTIVAMLMGLSFWGRS
jgi:hypothetical protein